MARRRVKLSGPALWSGRAGLLRARIGEGHDGGTRATLTGSRPVFIKALALCFISLVSATPRALGQTSPAEQNSCSIYNAECNTRCSARTDMIKQCANDCAKRQQECLNTGIYERLGKPPETDLTRR